MTNLASIYQSATRDNSLIVATVTSQFEDVILIAFDGLSRSVKVASSCLLCPEVGDAVLVFLSETENSSYAISILSKAGLSSSSIKLPGGATISTLEDKFKVQAEVIELSSSKHMGISSPVLNVSAIIANVVIELIRGKFNFAKFLFKNVNITSSFFKSSIERIVQTSRYSSYTVDQTLSTKAGSVRTDVKNGSSLNASHVSVNAKNCVRIDGNKIDLG